jgi:hypothetical protein
MRKPGMTTVLIMRHKRAVKRLNKIIKTIKALRRPQ